jgi:hypothetical protein
MIGLCGGDDNRQRRADNVLAIVGTGQMSVRRLNLRPLLGFPGCAGVGILLVLFCYALLLSTCVSRVEVMKAYSPNRSRVAAVFEINGGATTDFAYEVDVSRASYFSRNREVARLYGAGRNDCAYGVNIRWPDNETLLITYKDAKSANIDKNTHILGTDVRVLSRSGVNDPTAPCGGMEYSQSGRVVSVH